MRLPLRASRIRRQRYLLSMRRIRQTKIDKLIQILVVRFERVQRVIGGAQKGQRGKRQALQDQMRRKRVQRQWGSCCMMRFAEGMRIAIIGQSCLSPMSHHKLMAYLWETGILLLHLLPPSSKLFDADPQSPTFLDRIIFPIQPKFVTSLKPFISSRSRGRP